MKMFGELYRLWASDKDRWKKTIGLFKHGRAVMVLVVVFLSLLRLAFIVVYLLGVLFRPTGTVQVIQPQRASTLQDTKASEPKPLPQELPESFRRFER